jgi:predicted metal-dependent hydrolase
MDKYDLFIYFIIGSVLFACIYFYFDNQESFQLKCIVSDVDGNKYCVREREHVNDAADLLATVTEKMKSLVEYVGKKYPNQENVKRLVDGFNPKKVIETLPTSTYTAYSENKGEKVAFCLNKQKTENDNLIDENTLTFVGIHEISHIMTKSIGHKSEFWENFKFLLENAKEAGIHNPVDYKKKPQEYCGMTIHDNPYYDA